MNSKSKLNELKNKLLEKSQKNNVLKEASENFNLDNKVDNFIDWYQKNMVNDRYTNIGKFYKPNDMRNFIEKVAVWYELRYPDYEINKMMPGSSYDNVDVNDIMFKNNNYINEAYNKNSDVRNIDWKEFYNPTVFINSLPWSERYLFTNAKYKDVVYINVSQLNAHLHLTPDGIVEEAEDVENYTKHKFKDDELKGMHIKDVVKLFKEKGIYLPYKNDLEKTIKEVDNWNYQKEEMLNCVMYRLIERGGNRVGPRRAFLFAKEFSRNIDIPMMYGVDYSDPGHKFIFHIYYFRNILPSNEKTIIIEDISESRIIKENNLSSTADLFRKKSVMFNGREFSCFRGGGLNDMTILFGKYNCLTYFYELLKAHFDDYFKSVIADD